MIYTQAIHCDPRVTGRNGDMPYVKWYSQYRTQDTGKSQEEAQRDIPDHGAEIIFDPVTYPVESFRRHG